MVSKIKSIYLKWVIFALMSLLGIIFVLFGTLFSICIGNYFIKIYDFPPTFIREWESLQRGCLISSALFLFIVLFLAFTINLRKLWLTSINLILSILILVAAILITVYSHDIMIQCPLTSGNLWNKTLVDEKLLEVDENGIRKRFVPRWLNQIQLETTCCGIDSAYDYQILWNITNSDFRVPYSCCIESRREECKGDDAFLDDMELRMKTIQTGEGCVKHLNKKIQSSGFITFLFGAILLSMSSLFYILLHFLLLIDLPCFEVYDESPSEDNGDADGVQINSGGDVDEKYGGGGSGLSSVGGNSSFGIRGSSASSIGNQYIPSLDEEIARSNAWNRIPQARPDPVPDRVPRAIRSDGSNLIYANSGMNQNLQNYQSNSPRYERNPPRSNPKPEVINYMADYMNSDDSELPIQSQSADSMKEVRKKVQKGDKMADKKKNKFLNSMNKKEKRLDYDKGRSNDERKNPGFISRSPKRNN